MYNLLHVTCSLVCSVCYLTVGFASDHLTDSITNNIYASNPNNVTSNSINICIPDALGTASTMQYINNDERILENSTTKCLMLQEAKNKRINFVPKSLLYYPFNTIRSMINNNSNSSSIFIKPPTSLGEQILPFNNHYCSHKLPNNFVNTNNIFNINNIQLHNIIISNNGFARNRELSNANNIVGSNITQQLGGLHNATEQCLGEYIGLLENLKKNNLLFTDISSIKKLQKYFDNFFEKYIPTIVSNVNSINSNVSKIKYNPQDDFRKQLKDKMIDFNSQIIKSTIDWTTELVPDPLVTYSWSAFVTPYTYELQNIFNKSVVKQLKNQLRAAFRQEILRRFKRGGKCVTNYIKHIKKKWKTRQQNKQLINENNQYISICVPTNLNKGRDEFKPTCLYTVLSYCYSMFSRHFKWVRLCDITKGVNGIEISSNDKNGVVLIANRLNDTLANFKSVLEGHHCQLTFEKITPKNISKYLNNRNGSTIAMLEDLLYQSKLKLTCDDPKNNMNEDIYIKEDCEDDVDVYSDEYNDNKFVIEKINTSNTYKYNNVIKTESKTEKSTENIENTKEVKSK